ncbi:MAG: CoA transferase, partial [Candidatus Thorarchaeota archaeon]|nr:CoA transferase [Candidatus Thorarchaeota archaeon]NIW50637.1 CoA transferase [Candidatus Korarchaeota archaeon]
VYASISGFGQYGPYKERAGYDIIGQAMGGLLSITGWPDGPPTRSGTAIGDILSSLFCTIGILAALKIREKTGKGQLVDVSLVDSVFASLENIPQRYFAEGVIPSRIGNRYEFVYPYDSFETKDGFVIIGIANDSIWRRFVEATRIQQIDDKKYYTNALRVENHESLKPLIEGWTKKRGKNEIIDILNNNGIPSSPIYDIKNIVGDEHIAQAREMVLEQDQPGIGKIKVLGNPIKMSRTRPAPRGPAPRLGENTESVLLELLEVTGQEYKKLVHKKVI